jgi:tetratricopeptide (TPR) repeat protein
MKRWLLAGVLVLMVAGVVRAQEIITYRDRVKKKDEVIKAAITAESPSGIKIKVKEGKKDVTRTIKAADIVQIVYSAKDVAALEFRRPFGLEARARLENRPKQRAELLEKALADYRQLEPQLKPTPNARRYIQFKIGELLALEAQDDPSKLKDAIKQLSDFVAANKSSWQIVSALKLLGKLQEEDGDQDGARKTFEELAEIPDVPRELKQESEILVGRLLLRAGKHADAQKKLAGLARTMSKDDVQRPFILAYLAEAQIAQNNLETARKQLEEAIGATTDPRLRGLAYNLLGDFHRKKNQLEDAFWAYLRVDALYNEDPEEQAKALHQLGTLFDQVKKDPIRARECLRKLRDKRFAGTAAQKLLPAEKKDTEKKDGKKK